MVNADVSGVAFSADPVSGDRNTTVVAARESPATLRHAIRSQRTLAEILHRRDKALFYRDFVVEEAL
jgi:phosphoenolpyruvate synthase/pyruvate phosphate dikinase